MKARNARSEERHAVIFIKTNIERVPEYRLHHIEIKKNILSPNTMMTFVPHLRDLSSSEEAKYDRWLDELHDIDVKSGFRPMDPQESAVLTKQAERAATISLYLDSWLERLKIPHCDKAALIAYWASQQREVGVVQGGPDALLWPGNSSGGGNGPEARLGAAMFVEAWEFFQKQLPPQRQVGLWKVLLLGESVDANPDAEQRASTRLSDEDEVAESTLGTYAILGCLICFSHSCDHGEYDAQNWKRTFSMSMPLSQHLKRRRQLQLADSVTDDPVAVCKDDCRVRGPPYEGDAASRPWTEDDITVLRSLFVTASHSSLHRSPFCTAARFLERDCQDVSNKLKNLGVALPSVSSSAARRTEGLSWYDRQKKTLVGDWQVHTVTHDHQRREITEPCSHDGLCAPRVCPCVDAGVLCEKWCNCPAECARRFTGCACHSLGVSCLTNQDDSRCICIQLNRECDPELCLSCGANDRADPVNAEDQRLHATGCQNCDLQRGVGRTVLLGKSQLEGVGYGLFAAEDIAQGVYVIEYVGELITHDEGVRREARRAGAFEMESHASYVFTLLENEGTWVDAARYGNLSRYINHASKYDRRSCNVTPQVVYVNGEHRIKFIANREIKAGEELFFDYGDNFPNLTRKLLDSNTGKERQQTHQTKRVKTRKTGIRDERPRKTPKQHHKGKTRRKRHGMEPTGLEGSIAMSSLDVAAVYSRERDHCYDNPPGDGDYLPRATDGGTALALDNGRST